MSAPLVHARSCSPYSCDAVLAFVCPWCGRTCAPCFGADDTDPELCDDCADREARSRDLCALASFCNAAAARAVRLIHPRWKHVPERHQFIHAAVVSRVGFGVLDSCQRQIMPTKKRRSR